MSLSCNVSGNEYNNCSALLEGVELSVIVLHTCISAILILVTIPINILMIVAMVIYHHLLDKVFLVSISFLVSNVITAIFYLGQVFITSLARAWVFGYWGCQLFAFFGIVGAFSRWITVGLLSVNRFWKVFFPFSHPGKFLVGILLSSWMFSVTVPIVLYFGNATGFDVTHPGCFFVTNFSKMSHVYCAIIIILLVCASFTGAILPSILYTAMYLKGRRFRKVQPVRETPDDHPENVESQQRSRRVTVTYCLLMLSFLIFTALLIFKVMLRSIFRQIGVSSVLSAAILLPINDLIFMYLIVDLGILLINKDEHKVLNKLLHRVFKQVCWKGNLWRLQIILCYSLE